METSFRPAKQINSTLASFTKVEGNGCAIHQISLCNPLIVRQSAPFPLKRSNIVLGELAYPQQTKQLLLIHQARRPSAKQQLYPGLTGCGCCSGPLVHCLYEVIRQESINSAGYNLLKIYREWNQDKRTASPNMNLLGHLSLSCEDLLQVPLSAE